MCRKLRMDTFVQELNRPNHPLLDPKIIQRILEHIPCHQYRELRKLCRIWNEESCKLIQVRELVSLGPASKCVKYTKTFTRPSEIPEDFPFPHSRFQFPKIRMNMLYNNYALRQFFKAFSPRVKHLNLTLSRNRFKMKFLRMLILQNLQSLESLTINFYNFLTLVPPDLFDDIELLPLPLATELIIYGYGNEDHMRSILSKILTCLPNLQKVEAGELQGRLLFDILYGPNRENLPCKPSIIHLDLGAVSLEQIENIITNKLHLKSLKAELLRNVEAPHIQILLNHLAADLTELKLDLPKPNISRFVEPLTPMTSLVKLEISRFELNISILTNRNFPVLQSLKLSHVDLLYEEKNVDSHNSTLCVISLNICSGLTPSLIKTFGHIFPSLRQLIIKAHLFENRDYLLGTVDVDFKNLKELRINDEVLTDIIHDKGKNLPEIGNLQLGSADKESCSKGETWIGRLKKNSLVRNPPDFYKLDIKFRKSVSCSS